MIKEKIAPQMIVASTQHFVKTVSDELIEQFTNNFEENIIITGAKKTEPQNFFTVFHVAEFRDTDYDMELWTQVDKAAESTEQIQFKTIDKSEIAYLVVADNYDNLDAPYISLFSYINENGYKLNGFPRETYLLDEKAALGFLTEIQIPFKR